MGPGPEREPWLPGRLVVPGPGEEPRPNKGIVPETIGEGRFPGLAVAVGLKSL